MPERLFQDSISFLDGEMVGVYLDRLMHRIHLELVIDIRRQRRLQPLIECGKRLPGRLVLHDPKVDMRICDVRDGILESFARMSAGDPRHLDGRFQSYLGDEIGLFILEHGFHAEVRHQFLLIGFHPLIPYQDLRLHILHIIIEIRDGYLIVHVIELAEDLIHLMDGVGDDAAVES